MVWDVVWEYHNTFPASWETCMQIKQQQLEMDMEQQTDSKLGKEYVKAVYYTLLIELYAEYIIWNTRLDEAQEGIKIAGEITITSDTQMTLPLWQKVKRN